MTQETPGLSVKTSGTFSAQNDGVENVSIGIRFFRFEYYILNYPQWKITSQPYYLHNNLIWWSILHLVYACLKLAYDYPLRGRRAATV